MSLFDRFYALAKKAKLSFPTGRAWYLVGRCYNGAVMSSRYLSLCGYNGEDNHYHDDNGDNYYLRHMQRMKENTARRWNRHYKAGGCAKCLQRTKVQENAKRRDEEKRRRQVRFDSAIKAMIHTNN